MHVKGAAVNHLVGNGASLFGAIGIKLNAVAKHGSLTRDHPKAMPSPIQGSIAAHEFSG
jgi:hypothetical protein